VGLDISFSREKAIKAGIILEAEYDRDYKEIVEVVKLPEPYGDAAWRINDGFVRGEPCEKIAVRANMWGVFYAPLTKWLDDNQIEWEEF